MISTHGVSMTSAHYARMGEAECRQIHLATLEVLERVGVDVHQSRAREILAEGGARVDGIRVRIPEYLVEDALRKAPRRMTIYDRNGRVALRAQDYNTYYGGGSDCLHVLDHHTGRRREPLLKDVADAARLMDALPELDFVMSLFLPKDVNQQIYDRYQMEIMLNHTIKPIVYVTPDFEGCRAAVEMCEAVAGGVDAFRAKPFAACYINVTSGLVANEEALQKCIYLAEKGLPMMYIPLNAGGVNSPSTTAGCMATMNAGIMLGIVLSQLINPGTPVAVPGWNGGPYNLKTMVGNYVLADEQGVPTTLGKYYQLPVFGLGGSTDSKVLDMQCGFETTLSLMTALLHGANIVHDVGFMDSGLQGSLQLLVMANEFIGFLRASTRGVPVDEEALALDVVEELGPTGDYLQHPHTMRHVRDPFYSDLMHKGVYAQWEKQGQKTMEQLAAEKVDRFLDSHTVAPLAEDVQQAISDIVARELEWISSRTGNQ
jgi:trimethylamine--corrinoid protein Co-methyltransferase